MSESVVCRGFGLPSSFGFCVGKPCVASIGKGWEWEHG